MFINLQTGIGERKEKFPRSPQILSRSYTNTNRFSVRQLVNEIYERLMDYFDSSVFMARTDVEIFGIRQRALAHEYFNVAWVLGVRKSCSLAPGRRASFL
jgi:hypothetical protein